MTEQERLTHVEIVHDGVEGPPLPTGYVLAVMHAAIRDFIRTLDSEKLQDQVDRLGFWDEASGMYFQLSWDGPMSAEEMLASTRATPNVPPSERT